jgi:hypothetical protein
LPVEMLLQEQLAVSLYPSCPFGFRDISGN